MSDILLFTLFITIFCMVCVIIWMHTVIQVQDSCYDALARKHDDLRKRYHDLTVESQKLDCKLRKINSVLEG